MCPIGDWTLSVCSLFICPSQSSSKLANVSARVCKCLRLSGQFLVTHQIESFHFFLTIKTSERERGTRFAGSWIDRKYLCPMVSVDVVCLAGKVCFVGSVGKLGACWDASCKIETHDVLQSICVPSSSCHSPPFAAAAVSVLSGKQTRHVLK